MKRNLAAAMAAILVLSAGLVGCGDKSKDASAGNSAKTEKKADVTNEEKKEGDTFTVGFDASFPPYGYKDDDGEYVGFDLDLAQEVCKRNGWELEKQPIDWDAKDMELNSGTIDCIWNGFTINGREEDYTWSEPYVDNSQVVVVSQNSGIKTLDDLAGKIVEVQADSSALKALEGDQKELAGTFGTLTQVPDYNTAFMDLEAGAAEAVAMDVGVADYQIESRGDGYVILDDSISTEQYAVGFKKGNEKLKDQVQKTLDEMAKDGTFMTIAEKWGVEDAVCLGK
ncbi:amino acid ABC transporter substrate-binding protein [Muricomes intestini]|jgi:polar amino acid transport system substrate-binding protein|uniref:Amino acid ABC transporter substrate-binding protein (PAAT family) n=1 Tax=Muricomes intestini TaxID=1796634 RepID=A0A4V6NYT9_9FIRM|nr:amino acid ABC transporter substrate-binding protein [Muricomes intestini]TCS76734.1 amino acid ABC transporter substrate-binding protein (PAAT family) [Muricomes intestini]HAX51736.1 ABC transporter substrate-binding protein [Lachnospiraceae bacterium]HCR82235.1 ABC transporter substrate-binding protein [Lachnospiraceae bacterium]